MIKMKMILTAATAVFLFSSPAEAVDVSEGDDCQLVWSYEPVREGENKTTIFISQDQQGFEDDIVSILFMNKDWSITDATDLGTVRLENINEDWLEYSAFAAQNAFILRVTYEHFTNVFTMFPEVISVTRGKVKVGTYSMKSFYSDRMAFDRCRKRKVERIAEEERRKSREAANPKDPFAQ